jgi:hypothetical protein
MDSGHTMFDTGIMKVKDKVVLVHAMWAYGGAQAQLPSFSTLLLDRDECSVPRLGRFTLGIHSKGGCVCPSASLNVSKKIKISYPCQK